MKKRITHLRLVGPVAAFVGLLLLGLAAIPFYGSAHIDDDIRKKQEALVERNIAIWVSDVEFALTAWTIWDESIARIDNNFDLEWTERNIGSSLLGTSRTRFAAILDRTDKLIYSKLSEEVRYRPFFARSLDMIEKDAARLVQQVRENERLAKSDGIPPPIAFSTIKFVGDDAVLLTASLFQPDFRTATPLGAHAPILITAVPIAGSLQEFLGNRFMLDDATVGPENTVEAERARVKIASGIDGRAQVLSWRPLTPASDLFYKSLPLAAAITLILAGGAVLAVRMSRKSIDALINAEERMRHAATHDFLTGLGNRSLVASEFAKLAQQGQFFVVCLDLDGFKAVNDEHGHAAGDELLRQVGVRLKSACSKHDTVLRLGGDEFVLLMPALDFAEIEDRCRRVLAQVRLPYLLAEYEVNVGASFGICEVSGGDLNSDQALQRADKALYDAKRAGRGSIAMAAPEPVLRCA